MIYLYISIIRLRVESMEILERTGIVNSQNRPPPKIQLSTTHFIDFIKKYEFSVKLDDLSDSKM